MDGKTAEGIPNEFSNSDVFRCEWAILKYMCDTSGSTGFDHYTKMH